MPGWAGVAGTGREASAAAVAIIGLWVGGCDLYQCIQRVVRPKRRFSLAWMGDLAASLMLCSVEC